MILDKLYSFDTRVIHNYYDAAENLGSLLLLFIKRQLTYLIVLKKVPLVLAVNRMGIFIHE